MPQPVTPTPAQRRRERERKARRERIRAAARDVFARHGYDAATMEQVAEAAEMGKASLYYYFPTKHALMADLVEAASAALGEAVGARVSEGGDAWDVLRDVFRTALGMFAEDPLLASTALPLMAAGPEAMAGTLGADTAGRVMAAHRPLYEAVAAAAGTSTEAALVPLLATAMLGMATKIRHGQPFPDTEIELFFRLLARGGV